MDRLTVYYDTQAADCGWAYCLSGETYSESEGLAHTRRNVSLAALARSVRRQYRGAQPDVRLVVARLTRRLAPARAGDGYEAQSW